MTTVSSSTPTMEPPSTLRSTRRQRAPKAALQCLPSRPVRARAMFNATRIEVFDPHDQACVWIGGAFGTGAWSRSEPTWKERTEALVRKAAEDEEQEEEEADSGQHVEDISRQRKQERMQRKASGNNATTGENGVGGGAQDPELLDTTQIAMMNAQRLDMSTLAEPMLLLPEECVFLAAHRRLAIRFQDEPEPCVCAHRVWDKLGFDSSPVKRARYAAYATFRRAGWAVRCGAKFGADYLLYAKGPQFGHSKYAVIVVPTDSAMGYDSALPLPDGGATWLKTAQRVVGQAKKKLLLCRVALPPACVKEHAEQTLVTNDHTVQFSSLAFLPLFIVSFVWYTILLTLFQDGPKQAPKSKPTVQASAGTIPTGSLPALPAAACPPQIKGARVSCIEVGRWNPGKNRE